MTKSDLVRFSRDGDQFHYRWAARRCLRLLSSGNDLAAVTIEGISKTEEGGGPTVDEGEELVDVAEYYGSQVVKTARRIEYIQLKHSTARKTTPWSPSELAKTLKGFSKRYQNLRKKHGARVTDERLCFSIVTNRPFSTRIVESVADLSTGAPPRHEEVAADLRRYTELPDAVVSKFFERLTLNDHELDYKGQADRLDIEANAFLATGDVDVALRLKELVTSRATSDGIDDSSILLGDVLQALRVSPEDLFPAPSLIPDDPQAIPREQEAAIAATIVAASAPVLVSATGGVGKSILATRLGSLLPTGSIAIVYDCFGNGEYRRIAQARHPHGVALVQIANELASQGLCDPLLPAAGADPRAYMRAFIGRLHAAAATVRARSATALITVIVDAADNAQMAAEEAGGAHAFVRDLIRHPVPEGVRLVMLYRPEREHLLQPPHDVVRLPLVPFTLLESTAHLRRSHPSATDADALEFHRLSSANPRVQANAMAAHSELPSLLHSLGPDPTSVDDQIAKQLEQAFEKVKYDAGPASADIEVLCAALAALRPLVPIKVLAEMSGLSPDAIRSFVSDFGGGRPLLVAGESVQFRDEPVEAWFRQTYRADKSQLVTFVERLKPLADRDTYVAACLPQLMLACDQLGELVEMALSRARLPTDSPLARRQIEVERLQFALRASLRARRWTDAARLAMKAGEECAGAERHDNLLSGNPDLVGLIFDPERLQDLVARQVFASGGWLGRRYAREAVLLSRSPELRGEALSKLRLAENWLGAWARLTPKQREEQRIDDEDRANLALAHLNLQGADAACAGLMRWFPDKLWHESGLILTRLLVDHGRFDALEELAASATARGAAPLLAAISMTLAEVNRRLPLDSAKALLAAKPSRQRTKSLGRPWLANASADEMVPAVVALLQEDDVDRKALARQLQRFQPKEPPGSISSYESGTRSAFLRSAALRAALLGEDLQLTDVAPKHIRQSLDKADARYDTPYDVREFKSKIGALLPWWKLWAKVMVAKATGEQIDLRAEIDSARKAINPTIHDYNNERSEYQDEAARIWFDIICEAGEDGPALAADFERWAESLTQPLYIPTWSSFARKAARSPVLHGLAHSYADRAVNSGWDHAAEDADSRIETRLSAARSIFSLDPLEAAEYLNSAVEVATKLGDDVYDRWAGVMAFAEKASTPGAEQHERAYRLSRSAELCAEYIDRHFDWSETILRIAGLAPSSAIAIVSRWRDREVGWFEQQFDYLITALVSLDVIDPTLVPSFIGFRFFGGAKGHLERALGAVATPSSKQTLFDLVVRYEGLDGGSVEEWRDYVALGRRHGLAVDQAEMMIERARTKPVKESRTTDIPRREETDWTTALANWPVETPTGAIAAFEALEAASGPFDRGGFWRAVLTRVPATSVPTFIEAVMQSPALEIYGLRVFLESIPANLKQRQAVKRALRQGMENTARCHCWSLAMNPRNCALPVPLAADLTGVPQAAIIEQLVAGIADDVEPAGSSDLFRLAPMLATLLPPTEAQEALDYALSLIEASIEPASGDGEWFADLAPKGTIPEALAGLVWGTLGAVQAEMRWQAAHVVRALARVGRRDMVHYLVKHAQLGAGVYVSPQLPFYDLHALQWFVMALASAARETPEIIGEQAAFLKALARRDYPHVLIRHFAADALLAIASAPDAALTEAEIESLKALNKPALESREVGYGQAPHFDKYETRDGEKDFLFDYVGKERMEGVARSLGVSIPDFERAGEVVIRQDWGISANGYWKEDPRRNHRTLSRSASGRNAAVSSYNSYLTYHATMAAAGKLLETRPPLKYRGDRVDEFSNWLQYRLLTRADGLWVFDRRDPTPNLPPRPPETLDDDWRWAVSPADFDRALGRAAPQLVIWGDWTEVTSAGSEHIHVHSVLVEPAKSRAYLVGAQTANHPWDFYPHSEDRDEEIDDAQFKTRAWVLCGGGDRGLDRDDPWAASLQYPPPVPALGIRTEFGLHKVADGRRWLAAETGTVIFSSEVWAETKTGHDSDARAEGDRLMIEQETLLQLLEQVKMDAIVEVEVRRDVPKWKRQRSSKSIDEGTLPYFRFYLVKHDGGIENLS